MLRIIEDKNLCEKRGVNGMYILGFEEIVVADRNDKAVLCHEVSHYLYDIGSTKYLDSILDICNLLGVNFWDVVDIESVSEQCFSYEEFIDEILAYFMEEVYNNFPMVVLQSHFIYRIILER